jgi:hypothetical protein
VPSAPVRHVSHFSCRRGTSQEGGSCARRPISDGSPLRNIRNFSSRRLPPSQACEYERCVLVSELIDWAPPPVLWRWSDTCCTHMAPACSDARSALAARDTQGMSNCEGDKLVSRTREQSSPIVTFHRVFTGAIPPMRADKSALGSLPTAAYQYCEAIRTASGFGWYIFPPLDMCLKWNGAEVFHKDEEGEWRVLSSAFLGDEFNEYWDTYAPADLKGWRLPYLSSVFLPGVVQVWSGLLVSTAKDWSVLVRPLANTGISTSFQYYEGIVESDEFCPCPLFVNIRLIATDRELLLSRESPLFQVQPVHRSSYQEGSMKYREYEGIQPRRDGISGMSPADWAGLRTTTRSLKMEKERMFGTYGSGVRKRAKKD